MSRWSPRIAMSVVVGAVAGLAAAGLDRAIHFGSEHLIGHYTHFGRAEFLRFEWAVVALPALGCFVAALAALLLAPRAHGHGVDIMTRAFHRHLGRLPLRGPAVKAAGTAVVISSGGSAGPEGPTAALGAAIGSSIARLVPISAQNRRILLIAGCAAGIGAIFRCPLGGALFAASVPYSDPEFESDALVPSLVASVIGYSIYMLVFGFKGPMLSAIDTLHFASPPELLWYAVLGVLCGAVSIFFSSCIRGVELLADRAGARARLAYPLLGGLGTGLIACLLPQVMDGRFVFIQNAIDGALFDPSAPTRDWATWTLIFGAVALAKCVATALTVGSGAPGGVLGPSVFIGGALGACVGAAGHVLMPDAFPEELRRALIAVGMAGVLAATMRAPLAAPVMTMEMTGSIWLIAPLMLVCAISYLIGRRWGLNREQVRTSADSPTHAADPIIHLLEAWRVRDVMQARWPMTIEPAASVDRVIREIEPGARPVIAVAEGGVLRGVISATDLGRVMREPGAARALIAADIMTTHLETLRDDADLYSALARFTRVEHEVLPVLDRDGAWVGMLARRDVVDRLRDELHRVHESVLAEHASLKAIEGDVALTQLIMGVSGQHPDVQKLFVPIEAIGKSLRECDFRREYNAQVIAVEQRDGSLVCPPDLDAPLATDQRLLAVVWRARGS